jgi:hypothetical protein
MLRALPRHPVSIAGALLTTVAAVLFLTLIIAELAGLLNNPYAGLVVFVAIPALFVLGLLLIPFGAWLERRRLRRDPTASSDWPVLDFRRPHVRRGAIVFIALTAVNLMVVLLAGYGSLHYMESPQFCGQTCHTPMQPQHSAWQAATHARIACVKCHIGEGPRGFVRAKLAGVRQLAHVATGGYPRPIPPGAEMPPGAQAQTCLACHQPAQSVGDRIRVIRTYADDETNTETRTILQMRLGAANASGRAIHWHADPGVTVEYVAADEARETIPYVKVTRANGEVKEFVVADTPAQTISSGHRRTMDCMDCHNTVGHPIAQSPELAVDDAIAAGRVPRDLPFVRREGIRLIKESYPGRNEALAAIDKGVRSFYASQSPSANAAAVDRAVGALQNVYRGNVFPAMKVTYGSYPNQKGHITSTGCFRCHDDSHTAKDGSKISADCEYCHTQVETP